MHSANIMNDFLGSRNDGGFAEYVKVSESNLLFVPENVDEEAVAFLEPISVALHVVQNCRVNYGDSVAVFGLGAIGIFVAQWAKAFGAKHVFAIDLDEKKVEIAKSMGLVDALCIGKDDIDAIVKEKQMEQESTGHLKHQVQVQHLNRQSAY